MYRSIKNCNWLNYYKSDYLSTYEKSRESARKMNKKPINKIRHNLRRRIRTIVKSKSGSFTKLIGCTRIFLREWLENRFLPEMNWDNYGKVWVVDHIKPVSKFNLQLQEDLLKVNHYTNLQPLFRLDNLIKGNKYDIV